MRFDESTTFNPGLARHRIVIKTPGTKTKDDFGGDVTNPEVYATVRAQIVALKGRELEAVQQRWAKAQYRIRCQYVRGVEREYTIDWRTEQGTLTLDILDVRDPAGTANYTEIIAADAESR